MPSLTKEVELAAIQELQARGAELPMTASGEVDAAAIDWDKFRDKFREFLEWFIPFLIELIGQFAE
jgi:hypothetical protein